MKIGDIVRLSPAVTLRGIIPVTDIGLVLEKGNDGFYLVYWSESGIKTLHRKKQLQLVSK